jgi:hypothetical protein
MNPMDPRISEALKEIESVYSGQEAAHAYYGQESKLYVLIVSGEEAEAYHHVVRAIRDLAAQARRRAAAKTP